MRIVRGKSENPIFPSFVLFVLDSDRSSIAPCERVCRLGGMCVWWHSNESSIRDKDHFYVCHPKNHILNCEKRERKSLPPPSATVDYSTHFLCRSFFTLIHSIKAERESLGPIKICNTLRLNSLPLWTVRLPIFI